MGQEYLIDTNILIDFQNGSISQAGQEFVAKIIDLNFSISFVSYIEFLGYKNATNAMEDFISFADVLETNRSIINQTILLRKNSRIKLPDAIIASTAIAHKLILITRNIQDFTNITGLKILNPYTL